MSSSRHGRHRSDHDSDVSQPYSLIPTDDGHNDNDILDPARVQRNRDYAVSSYLEANLKSAQIKVDNAEKALHTKDGTDEAVKKVNLAQAKADFAQAYFNLNQSNEALSTLTAANSVLAAENLAYKLAFVALQNSNNPTSVQPTGSQDSLSCLEGTLTTLKGQHQPVDPGLKEILNSAQYCLNFENTKPFFDFLDKLVGNDKFQQLLSDAASELKRSTRPAKNTHAIKQKLALDLQSAPELQEFIGILSDMARNTITPRGPETEIYPPFKEPIRPVALLAQIALVHQSFPDTTPFWDSFPGSDVKRSDDIDSMKQCFADALTIYTSHHLENVKNKSNPNVFLTLGSPGIGKSYYSLFLITYVMKLKIPITVTRTLDGCKGSVIGNKEFIAWSIDEYDNLQDPRLSIDFPQSRTDPFSHSNYLAKLELLFTKRSKKKRIFITDPIEVESQAAELLNNFANSTSSVSYQNSGNLFFSSHSMPLFGPQKFDKMDPGTHNSDFTYLNMEYTHDTLRKLFTSLPDGDKFQTRLEFSHLLLAPTIRNYVHFLTPSNPQSLVSFFCAMDQRECFPRAFLENSKLHLSGNVPKASAIETIPIPAAIAFSLIHRYNPDSGRGGTYISPYLASLGLRSLLQARPGGLEEEVAIVQTLQLALKHKLQPKLTFRNRSNGPPGNYDIGAIHQMDNHSLHAKCRQQYEYNLKAPNTKMIQGLFLADLALIFNHQNDNKDQSPTNLFQMRQDCPSIDFLYTAYISETSKLLIIPISCKKNKLDGPQRDVDTTKLMLQHISDSEDIKIDTHQLLVITPEGNDVNGNNYTTCRYQSISELFSLDDPLLDCALSRADDTSMNHAHLQQRPQVLTAKVVEDRLKKEVKSVKAFHTWIGNVKKTGNLVHK